MPERNLFIRNNVLLANLNALDIELTLEYRQRQVLLKSFAGFVCFNQFFVSVKPFLIGDFRSSEVNE